ncbi:MULTISPECIES: transglutaminase-like cysteine peptidase [unclassified Shewanella]|uniref:transglutaminase-like cysteine peptidase n=3 Tax=Shewanella TaxID=22 RepID=UPI000C846698
MDRLGEKINSLRVDLNWQRYWLLIPIVFSAVCFSTMNHNIFSGAFFTQIELKYGLNRIDDFHKWQSIIEKGAEFSDSERLHLVNQFANRHINFVSDIEHWNKNDYWGTPIESLGTKGGDCEDFAIFKYFTLKAMGVSEEKMRLMYVRALLIDQPHMVLIYFDNPKAMPLVLDNLTTSIKKSNQRTDLKPIYSFNSQGLWLTKARGLGSNRPVSTGSKSWTDLVNRIENGE